MRKWRGNVALVLVGVVLGLSAGWLPLAGAISGRSAPVATLDSILEAVRPPSNGQTRLLFPLVIDSAAPIVTNVSIANTGLDPFGTQGKTGTCAVHYYGFNAIPPQVSAPVAPGGRLQWSLGGGGSGIGAAVGFNGHLIVECDFPLAHGIAVHASPGGFWTTSALVLPSVRDPAVVEALGQ